MKRVLFLIFLVLQVSAVEVYSQDDEGFLGDGFESRPRQLFIIDGNEVWGWGNTKDQRAGTYDFQWENWTGTTCSPYYIKICINIGSNENPVYETIPGKTFTTPSGTSEYTLSEQKQILFFLYYNINNNSCMYVYYKSDGPPAPPQNLTVSKNLLNQSVLNWSANSESDLSLYKIYRARTSGNDPTSYDYVDQVSSQTTTWTDPDMTVGSGTSKVFYKILAIDQQSHESEMSNYDWINYDPDMQKVGIRVQQIENKLFNNHPNPFNPTTKIKYSIKESGLITLKVYDLLGREIATLINEPKSAGDYEVEFNGSNLQSGLYLYKLTIENYTEVKKMVLVK